MYRFEKGCRLAGTAVPVFSLRSEGSEGIGDFADLKRLAKWAALSGQHIIQILPVNDTTLTRGWDDSYPYSSISVTALNPVYLRLGEVGALKDDERKAAFDAQRQCLNALDAVDYPRVAALKSAWARALYAEGGAECCRSEAFRQFARAQAGWLDAYTGFCVERDGGAMPADYYRWLQFHLDRQLRDAHEYANSLGVALKGDIPIGVSPKSIEVRIEPQYFNLDMQAGAPPDQFSREGQNWGFPTYNWPEMAEDGYAWWKSRLGKMQDYFDAYRIDHILGFFRIWEIPVPEKSGRMGHFNPALPYSREEILNAVEPQLPEALFLEDPRRKGFYHPRVDAFETPQGKALEGAQRQAFIDLYDTFFYRRHNNFWKEEALKKLPVLKDCSSMLSCAEDLGMVPDCVPEVLEKIGILSLRVQRWSKDYKYLCVSTTGTHDTTPLRGWWAGEHGGEDPAPEICLNFVSDCLSTPAMLAIIPLQDWFSTEPSLRVADPAAERINDPADPHNKWRYRMPVTLEKLIENTNFNDKIKTLIHNGKRSN